MPDSSPLSDLRARLGSLPLDRAPLRRAGLLSVLLVALLVVGKAFGPSGGAALAPAPRHDVQTPTEEVSAAPRPSPRSSGWTGGRVLALVLLAAGGAVAVALHRRRGPAASGDAALDVIETHPLGPGHSLRLVGCGDEVLLLSVGGDGARLLRHWPREHFDRDAVSFADALAEAADDLDPDAPEPSVELEAATDAELPRWLCTPEPTSPLPPEEGQGLPRTRSGGEDESSTPPRTETLQGQSENGGRTLVALDAPSERSRVALPSRYGEAHQPPEPVEESPSWTGGDRGDRSGRARDRQQELDAAPSLGETLSFHPAWGDNAAVRVGPDEVPSPGSPTGRGDVAGEVETTPPAAAQWAEETPAGSPSRCAPEWRPVSSGDVALFPPPAPARGLRQFGTADA
ncbi:flagellar biosynthetic protein FliO [Rubrivirga sp.]|uniref:flagellar biosynthetic protein FliO n=1 Tax=Rubrivirga sp. TaxID=1885344 RepID=UPI003B51C682